MDKKENSKKSWIQYAIFAIVAIVLYATGLHTEVIGFAQRGLLETGLMNPSISREKPRTDSTTESIEKSRNPDASFELKLRDEDGNSVPLEQFKGKVIFMNFWATWCPPCLAEMPAINKLHDKMGDDVAFVMLSMDENFQTAVSFKKRKGYDFPIYALAGPLPAMYQSTALPTTFVIGADSKLELTHKGMADYDTAEFTDFLKSLQ